MSQRNGCLIPTKPFEPNASVFPLCLVFSLAWGFNDLIRFCRALQRVFWQILSRRREGKCQQVQSLEPIQFGKMYADCRARTQDRHRHGNWCRSTPLHSPWCCSSSKSQMLWIWLTLQNHMLQLTKRLDVKFRWLSPFELGGMFDWLWIWSGKWCAKRLEDHLMQLKIPFFYLNVTKCHFSCQKRCKCDAWLAED